MRQNTWILIADGARARILLNEGVGKGLKPAMDQEFEASRAATRDLGSDRPGRTFESADGSRHALAPRADWHQQEKQKFARHMAKVLDAAALRKTFDRLVLVGPPQTLGLLRQALKPGTRRLVSAEVAKDLINIAPGDLPRHLGDAVLL